MDNNILIIGIAGGTGSGKTTLTERIADYFADDATVICHDWYYKRHDDMPFSEREKLNYDSPEAFETELLVKHLAQLRQGLSVECPTYDYSQHNRADAVRRVEPRKVIILEGILIFAEPRLLQQLDIKVFVDTDADVRILRRIVRDVNERGRSLESVIMQYLSTVKPMHEMYVDPSKKNADIIVPEGGHNAVALDMLIDRIARHVNQW